MVSVSIALFLLYLLLTAVFDLRERRVPNWVVVAGGISAVLTLLLNTQPLNVTWTQAAAGAFLGFLGLLVFYAVGMMGAGDIKFAAVLGLWVGWQGIIPIWAVGTILAGLHGVFILVSRWFKQRLGVPAANETKAGFSFSALFQRNRWKRETPYAACLAAAAVIVMFLNSST